MRTAEQKIAGDECYTPSDAVARARLVLGRIDLDPASCAAANEVVRARKYFTKEQDGLRRRWRGRVWLNCPYSSPKPWVVKLLEAYELGDVSEAVCLFNSRTGSAWFDLLTRQAWRCETLRRIRFWGPSTNPNANGMQDQVFFYLGTNAPRFAAIFAEVGRVLPPAVGVTVGVTFCRVCARSLAGLRADAETCSATCRKRRQRLGDQRP